MDLITVEEMLRKSTGNHSQIYPLIKNRMSHYECEEVPFPDEFLFFEDRYLKIRRHMLTHRIQGDRIVDIGCELGFQSEIFPDWTYLGIDVRPGRFFNQEKDNVSYQVGRFPKEVLPDLANSVVISCMSLGYFLEAGRDALEQFQELAEVLGKARHLYLSTTPELRDLVSQKFRFGEALEKTRIQGFLNQTDKEFSLMHFTNEEI